MIYRLDHVVLAAADLDEAKAAFADATGVLPLDGGPHAGLGTRNALVSFGTSYLEIIAPDPEQQLVGNMGARLLELSSPRLLHWAVRVDDLAAIAARARDVGLSPGPIRHTSRRTPSGDSLTWALLGIGGHRLGGAVPFFIDWLDCAHPSTTAPRVGDARFEVSLPPGSREAKVLDPAPEDVTIVAGSPGIALRFDSPRGEIAWSEASPSGFSL
jgi:catechol 2,3-dioxygenase-like lactoylglutathione lyase family enzyme